MSPVTLLGLQSHCGDKPLKFQLVYPQNGTAVLKGLTLLNSFGRGKSTAEDDDRKCVIGVPVTMVDARSRTARAQYAPIVLLNITGDHSKKDLWNTRKPVFLPIFTITGDHS